MRRCRECMEREAERGHKMCGWCRSAAVKRRIEGYKQYTAEHGKPTLETLPEFRRAMKAATKRSKP